MCRCNKDWRAFWCIECTKSHNKEWYQRKKKEKKDKEVWEANKLSRADDKTITVEYTPDTINNNIDFHADVHEKESDVLLERIKSLEYEVYENTKVIDDIRRSKNTLQDRVQKMEDKENKRYKILNDEIRQIKTTNKSRWKRLFSYKI